MKRNQRTETRGHEDLTPLTEQILAKMGDEGAEIRGRLKKFYRCRSVNIPPLSQEPPDKTA
jgi:hypothetical protein